MTGETLTCCYNQQGLWIDFNGSHKLGGWTSASPILCRQNPGIWILKSLHFYLSLKKKKQGSQFHSYTIDVKPATDSIVKGIKLCYVVLFFFLMTKSYVFSIYIYICTVQKLNLEPGSENNL